MKMRRMGIKTKHDRGCDEAISQEILFQASQLRRHAAGIYGLGNFLIRARNKVVDVIRETLEEFDCSEISLPIMQPKTIWESSGRWSTYVDSKQMFTFDGRNGQYCLAPTGEEIVLDFVRENIASYKDLPINVFQIGNKYRDELRVRGGLLRSKEFLMKDGYSFHSSFEDMEREYGEMKKCYMKIFSKLSLDAIAVKAISAEMGGKNSEEFMCFSPVGEDKILINPDRTIALNTEVLDHPEILAQISQKNPDFNMNQLQEAQCIELGHIFELGTFYSKNMDGYYVDSEGQRKPYYMGCYGIGINRTLGAICENNCDQDGLIWPKSVAPYECVIIYLPDFEKQANELYSALKKAKIDVVLDDRSSRLGSKIKDSKLLGFPYMILIGKKFEQNHLFEIEDRKTSEKLFLNQENLIKLLKN